MTKDFPYLAPDSPAHPSSPPGPGPGSPSLQASVLPWDPFLSLSVWDPSPVPAQAMYLRRGPRRAARSRSRARWRGRPEPDGVRGCPVGRGSPACVSPGGPWGWGRRGAVAAAAAARAGEAVPGGGAAWWASRCCPCPSVGRLPWLGQWRAGARRPGGQFKGPAAVSPAPAALSPAPAAWGPPSPRPRPRPSA